MTQYLISFGAHAMDHVPDEDGPAVARAAHAAVQEAINAAFTCPRRAAEPGGEHRGHRRGGHRRPLPGGHGGPTLVDVPSREEALKWAAKIAIACRCAQEVRRSGPTLDAMLGQADSRR